MKASILNDLTVVKLIQTPIVTKLLFMTEFRSRLKLIEPMLLLVPYFFFLWNKIKTGKLCYGIVALKNRQHVFKFKNIPLPNRFFAEKIELE